MYQYMFYDYYLVYILDTVWDTSTSISNSGVLLYPVFDPLKQCRLDFSSPKQTFAGIWLLVWNELQKFSLFKYQLCQAQVNLYHPLPILLLIGNTRGVNVP